MNKNKLSVKYEKKNLSFRQIFESIIKVKLVRGDDFYSRCTL